METGITIYKPNRAVEARREMSRFPEVVNSLQPAERAVFLASIARTVSEYSGAELAGELKGALKWIAKDIGYRESDESEMQYLVIRTAEILKRYYGDFSLKDFRMAFEMSLTGELDEFLPKGRDGQPDRGHYQQFNAEYICKILNAYKAKRGLIVRKVGERVPKKEETVSEEEKKIYRDDSRQRCIGAFLEYKYRGRLPEMSPIAEILYYDILANVGLAEDVEIGIEEQREVFARTMSYYAGRNSVWEMQRLKKEGLKSKEIELDSFILARRKALERAMDWMIENEIQIKDYIRI